ncbi:MAG: hypothetical protein AABW89_01645 [Nanoarchaeota archaeon]
MGLLEEIQRMRMIGMQDNEIISKLQEEGNSYRLISEAISQSRIKQAVEDPDPEQFSPEQEMQENQQQEMQQSVMQPPQQETSPPQEYFSGYNPQNQAPENYQQGYEYNQSPLSSDTIMEISEQIVSEKLSDVRKKIEKISSFKSDIETKTEAIEERLKRIEKIIDSLQSSVLRKVGDYVTNVEDIKHELIETQKTFAKVLGSKHKHHENK